MKEVQKRKKNIILEEQRKIINTLDSRKGGN